MLFLDFVVDLEHFSVFLHLSHVHTKRQVSQSAALVNGLDAFIVVSNLELESEHAGLCLYCNEHPSPCIKWY